MRRQTFDTIHFNRCRPTRKMELLKTKKFLTLIYTFGVKVDEQLFINIIALTQYSVLHQDHGSPLVSSGTVREEVMQHQRFATSKMCNFCKRNGDPRPFFTSHNLRENGKVTCPILQEHTCELCGATGPEAHTR